MFPLRDDNPTFRTSFVTFGIIGLNVAAWALLQGLGQGPQLAWSVCELGAIPGELFRTVRPGTLTPLGDGLACAIDPDPNWLTPVTSMFLHGGWFHLIGNLWFLYVFGDNVEDSMSHARFAVFYVTCGLAAFAAQAVSAPASAIPMVGASGAIGGVMGAYAVLYPRVRVEMLLFLGFLVTRVAVPAIVMLGYWFLIQVIGGLPTIGAESGGVAFWAHVGGFVAGVALIGLVADPARVEAHQRRVGRLRRA